MTIVTITPIREKRNLYSPSFLKTPNTYLSGKGQMSVSVVTAQLSTVTTIKPFIIWEEWTALLSESICKGSYLSHIRLVLPYLIEIPSMPLQSKIGGLRRVAVGILKSGKAALVSSPISNRDITARGYPVISGWGQIRSPFAHSKRGKPHLFPPGKSGLCPSRLKSAPGKFRVLAGRLCVLVTDISGERLIRKWEGSRQLSRYFSHPRQI